jgi:hypothetical protein
MQLRALASRGVGEGAFGAASPLERTDARISCACLSVRHYVIFARASQ